jgi:vacuolar-type H+-ATPase subunit F/Vma7
MSRLLVLTRPSLVPGFRLAGVDAFGAEEVETAQSMIENWLQVGETGLLAIDDGLLANMDPELLKRLEVSDFLPYLAIPGGGAIELESSRRHRITMMIRQAIGFHITFKGEDTGNEAL